VRFPPLPNDRAHEAWARIVTPFVGTETAFMNLPEKGDEVLVAFVGGDPDRPVIIGAIWSGDPPVRD